MDTPDNPGTHEHPNDIGPAPAPPPNRGTATDTSRRIRNWWAIAGFVLSLAAIIAPAWLAYSFFANHDDWFMGTSLFGSQAGWTALFVILIFVPGELVLLAPAFVLSVIGTMRAKKFNLPNGSLGVSGLVISTIATILLVVVVVIATSNA